MNFPQSVKVVEMFLDVRGRMAGENGGDSGLVLDDDLWGHENSVGIRERLATLVFVLLDDVECDENHERDE